MLVTTEAWFRVRLEACEGSDAPAFETRGLVRLEAERSSLIRPWLQRTMTAFQKEMGF